MSSFIPWSPEELSILRDAYASGAGWSVACKHLPSRSPDAIKAKAERLQLFRRHRQLRSWSSADIAILAETYPRGGARAAHIALPDRTEAAIRKAAEKYGLRKGFVAPVRVVEEAVNDAEFPCDQDGCRHGYVRQKDLYRHQREKHGILHLNNRRHQRRVEAARRDRERAERLQRFAVRGRNANSADLWHILVERGILGKRSSPIAPAS